QALGLGSVCGGRGKRHSGPSSRDMTFTFAPPRGTASTMVGFGLKNMIANWPVLPLRAAETVAAIFAGLLMTKMIGFSIFESSVITPQLFAPLAHHTPLVIVAIVAALVVIAAGALAVNAFFAAASIRIYFDGQGSALAAMPRPPLAAFRAFRMR